MKYDLISAFWLSAAVFGVFGLGWVAAHDTVATECDKLGSFYVGSKTYTCARK